MIAIFVAAASLAFAQNAPPANPPAPAAAPQVEPLPEGKQQVLQALVIGVEGRAEWRPTDAAPWKPAALNDLLDPGAKIRTGLRSSLTLRVGKNATLLVDRSSRVELPMIVQDGAVLRTRAAIACGKCDFKVEAVGITSDFQVLTPSATLAVRGTGFSVQWGALYGIEVHGADTNRIRAIEVDYLATRDRIFLSAGAETSSSQPDPVQAALFHTVFPPPPPHHRFDDVGRDPSHRLPPPPFQRDFHRQQEVDHGGSDFGRDVNTGQGTPGIPPVHG